MTTCTYCYANTEQTAILATNSESGDLTFIPVDPANPEYVALIELEETISPYVAPAATPELTAEEKLANSGLTVEELKGLLGLN